MLLVEMDGPHAQHQLHVHMLSIVMLHADDSSVFDTSLSQEYAIAAASFGLSEAQLQALAGSAADYTFLNAEARAQLKQHILGK